MAFDLNKILAALSGGFSPIGPGPAGRRASAEAQLRYLPALQALGLLGQQTTGQFQQEKQGIRRGGLAAAQGINAISSNLTDQLSATPAPTNEAAASLGLTREAVTGDLARMEAAQRAAIPAGIAQARQGYKSEMADIVQQLMSTAQQGSLYNVSQFETLAQQNRENSQEQKRWMAEQRQARRQARQDTRRWEADYAQDFINDGRNPATGQPDPAYADPAKTGPTPSERRENREERREARRDAKDDLQRIKARYNQLANTSYYVNPDDPSKVSLEPTEGWEKRAFPPEKIQAKLMDQYGDKVPPIILEAGIQLGKGKISPEVAKRLRKRFKGLAIPEAWVGYEIDLF